MTSMSSKERMLTMLRYEEPDHVPLIFNPFGFVPPPHLAWSNQFERVQSWLSIEADAWLEVGMPVQYHPDVAVREWTETTPGERWPVMVKEYDTRAGVFRQEVYRTDDWITEEWPEHKSGDSGVQLLDDYVVRILGPGGGLALSPAEAIQPLTPWQSIEILLEAWREVRDYPIG